MKVDRIVACPDCHRVCDWCSWYAKNARAIGCGCPTYKRTKHRCEWGEAMKGSTCPLCNGTEQVRLVGQYQPTESETAHEA